MIEKEKNYKCKDCNYETTIKSNYIRHNLSGKHNEKYCINNTVIDNYKFVCCCGKTYKGRDGLWRHQQKCSNVYQNKEETYSDDEDDVENRNIENEKIWKELVHTLVNQNSELQKTLVEESKEFRETIANIQQQPNITNINTQNNTFNLQLFLNETCKDAMNIDDFIDSIKISIEDLKNLGKNGYVVGMSNLFIKNLEELDVSQRPLHCSDIKRETVYIRDKNLWKKENDQKVRLTKVATDISRINTIALQNEYQKMYPKCLTDFKSNEHNEYGKIAYEAFGGKLDIEKANKKLFRNIMKAVAINKITI